MSANTFGGRVEKIFEVKDIRRNSVQIPFSCVKKIQYQWQRMVSAAQRFQIFVLLFRTKKQEDLELTTTLLLRHDDDY